MLGRSFRLFAATAALVLLGASAASAGWFGGGCCGAAAPPVADWGCATSGCAPLWPSVGYAGYGGSGCCAPVRWGCGNPCGGGGYYGAAYGVSEEYAQPDPVYVPPQGPLYSPPLTGSVYPVYSGEEERAYPYVGGYGGRGYYGYPRVHRPYAYPGWRRYGVRRYGWGHRYVGPRVAHWAPSYYGVRHYGPRYGYPHRWYRGYPLRVRGQGGPEDLR